MRCAGQRREHDVDALQRPELADKHEVRGIVGQHRLVEFVRVETVRHDAHRAGGLPDELAEAARGKLAFENKPVGERREPLFRPDIDAPRQGGRRVMQAAAMRRVEGADTLALALQPPRRKPRIGATLGAVAVHDIDVEAPGEPLHLAVARDVGWPDLPGHRHARHPERAEIRKPRERTGGVLAAGLGVANDADLNPQLGLAFHQIMDVPEETSDRRPQAMENAK